MSKETRVSKRKANSGKMTIWVSGLRKCSKLHFHWRRYDIIILNNKIGGQKLGITFREKCFTETLAIN